MTISTIKTALKKIRTDDDRLAEVVKQLLNLTTEVEKVAKTAAEALARAKRAEK